MSRVASLFSGSSGNATYIGCEGANILVDVGVNAKGITAQLEKFGIDVNEISSIFLTHEHSDHVSGVKVLANRHKITVYATAGTIDYLLNRDKVYPSQEFKVIEVNKEYIFDNFSVKAFTTAHDASESCGYVFTLSDKRKVAVCTDLGHITDDVRTAITGCDVIFLESNHDEMMLQNGGYPYHLKRRILGPRGHISNNTCAAELPKLIETGTTRIILSHLSRENNYEELALATAKSVLKQAGYEDNKHYILRCAKPLGTEILSI